MNFEVILSYIIAIVVTYLIGSIPFGLLIGFFRKKDIRTLGSKNIGATNVFRTVGKGWGVLALLLDFCKGFFPVLLIMAYITTKADTHAYLSLPLSVGIAAVAGHNWTCFLGFKGGKGIATSAGILAALSPQGLLLALLVFIITVAISRYVSLSSILAAITLAISAWPIHYCCCETFGTSQNLVLTIALNIMAILAVYKHRANIVRLKNGTESKIF